MHLKTLLFVFSLLLSLPAGLRAQSLGAKADDIVGDYEVFDRGTGERMHLNFYRADDGDYEARIVWMENPFLR